jgi:death-on-curing protein
VASPVYLDRESVEFIAHRLAERLFSNYGEPLPAFQLMGEHGATMLDAALGAPRQSYYPSIYDKAGALLRSLIQNHPLVDGNKRVGMTSVFVFLAMNGLYLIASNEEMVELALEVARRKPNVTWNEISVWLSTRTLPVSASDEEFRGALSKLLPYWKQPDAVIARLTDYEMALGDLLE